MKTKMLSLFAFLSLLFCYTVGCGIPVDPGTTLETTSKQLTVASNQVIKAINTIQNLEEYQNAFTDLSGLVSVSRPNRTVPAPGPGQPAPKPGKQPDAKAPKVKLEQIKEADTRKFIEQYIFNEKNVVSQGSSEVVYKVEGSDFCKMFSGQRRECHAGPDSPKPNCRVIETGAPKECIQMVNDAKVSLVVTKPTKDSISIKVRVNNNQDLLELLIDDAKIQLKFFLGAIHKTIKNYADSNPKAKLPKEFPTKVEGELSLALGYKSPLTLSASIDKDLLVEGQAEGEKYQFSLKKQSPVISISFDEKAKKLGWDLNFNQIKAMIASKLFDKKSSGLVELALGGLSASMTLAAKQAFKLTNLGLGNTTSYLKHQGKDVVKLDLNPKHTRKFSLTLKRVNDAPEVQISPAFDLQAYINLSTFAEASKELGKWAKGTKFQIFLNNNGKEAAFAPVKGEKPLIKIKKGALLLKDITADKKLNVPEGGCIQPTPNKPAPDASFIDLFIAGKCAQ